MDGGIEEWERCSVTSGQGGTVAELARAPTDISCSVSEPPESISTAIIDAVYETGRHPGSLPRPEDLAQAKYWDNKIAAGELNMLSEITLMHVNIMAWGESGLGKTTFINNLVRGWGIKSKGAAFAAGGKTSPEMFRENPASMRLETQPIIDNTSNKGLIITIQDMPGWGDDINLVNNLRTVVRFLLKQRQADLASHKAGATESHPCPGTVMKHGITVCLYFLAPHRTKEVDWHMIHGISSLVAVVPVIAKADTLTEPEMEAYRTEILQVIDAAAQQAAAEATADRSESSAASFRSRSSSSAGSSLLTPFQLFRFSPSDLSAVQATNSLMPPFAVMGSQPEAVLGPEDAELGPIGSPCRRYLWGTALPLDRRHSDLIILKQLLTGHQNRAVYELLSHSWQLAHTFFKCHQHLKQDQLERLFEQGQLSSSPAAVLRAAEGLEVDLEPLVEEVCSSTSSFGGGQQQLQDSLRSEEQHMLEHQLRQAQAKVAEYQQLAEESAQEVVAARGKVAELEQLAAAKACELQQAVNARTTASFLIFVLAVLLVVLLCK